MAQQAQPTVRQATLADRDTIAAFLRAMAHETEGEQLDPEAVSAGVEAALRDPARGVYYVVEVGAEPVGQAMITREWSDWHNAYYWWMQSVYVAPAWRRRGVFRLLYDHLASAARASGEVWALRLYVHRDNAAACAAYERLGMTECEFTIYQMRL